MSRKTKVSDNFKESLNYNGKFIIAKKSGKKETVL